MEQEIKGLIEGAIVHYVLPDGSKQGQHRPAIVVRVWDTLMGTCNLQVFTDGSNDGPAYASGLCWQTSILFSEDKEPNTWHWPETV